MLDWRGPLTHRQSVAWGEWFRIALNLPSRDNYYQMLIACQTARNQAKHPNSVQPQHFLLKFTPGDVTVKKEERDKQIAMAKAHRAVWMGGVETMTVVDVHGNVLRHPIKPVGGGFINPRIRPPERKPDRTRVETRPPVRKRS